jgi:hypothetical protein
MFRNLVIPLDGSEFSAQALPVGVQFAAALGMSVHVIGVTHNATEYAWLYDHVHDDAKRAGIDAADVEIRVDDDPVHVLLEVSEADGNLLCFATHDRVPPASVLMHSVGSGFVERARRPYLAIGTVPRAESTRGDVVVAIDGVNDEDWLLATAAEWARTLAARLRIVTVYEPVPADIRNPEHFTRHHGPAGDPEAYLALVRERAAGMGVTGIDTVAIADPINPAAGIEQHLREAPSRLVVLGARRQKARHLPGGVARHLLERAAVPLLVLDRDEG